MLETEMLKKALEKPGNMQDIQWQEVKTEDCTSWVLALLVGLLGGMFGAVAVIGLFVSWL